MDVYITRIRQNKADHPRLQPFTLYADLMNHITGELLISATLDYIVDAIQKRGYTLIAVYGHNVRQS